MKKTCILILLITTIAVNGWSANGKMISPNGKITMQVKGEGFSICWNKKTVLDLTQVGMGVPISAQDLSLQKISKAHRVKDDYHMLSGKRLHCVNQANEYTCDYRDDKGKNMRMVFRLYNDGIAFRYELSGLHEEQLPKEQTVYRITEGTPRWMQQWADSYEGFFPLSTTAKVKAVPSYGARSISPEGWNCRWGYPALIEPHDGIFALITEANIERRQSASCLYNDQNLESFRVCPDENTVTIDGEWHSPWRIAIIGTLADVVESTLVTDVALPNKLTDTQWIKPGVVSWIYWAYNHGSNDMNIIKKYVDMAETLQLPYVLIDAEWDTMKDGKSIEDAINYAKSHGVQPMIWYNSSVGWINGAPTPKFRLNKPEDREREFAWCEKMGVAGIKIDFFSGDNQMNMDYCIELMECAARHHLLINFHGATIPRGWQRTYPNLLSTEGVYGAEWYNNVPTFTKKAAAHNATLPFTRNVVGPMDYTPCAFSDSQHPHITSHAHELALTVLFESGLQHLADKPESYFAQPKEIQSFFTHLPVAWDETHFISGYPGQSVVLARRSGNTWYVAGINGRDEQQTLTLNQWGKKMLKKGILDITLYADNDPSSNNHWSITHPDILPNTITTLPRGGFVLKITTKE